DVAVAMRIAGEFWLVDIWYCTTFWPARNTALPAVEMAVNTAFVPLPERNWSAMPPPQPRAAPSPAPACQVVDWSLWLCRLAGSGAVRFWHCALVVGWISGPTLAATARRPLVHSGSSGAR